MTTDSVNDVIVSLYRGSAEVPFSRFEEWALEQLRGVIRFDAAWWGRALTNPPKPLRVHLCNARPDIFEDYPRIQEHDFFRDAMLAAYGTTINVSDLITRKRYEKSPLYREYGRKHQIESAIGTVLLEPTSSLTDFLTLWRFDSRWPFSERDRACKQQLMPHLIEALRLCRLVSMGRTGISADSADGKLRPWALAGAGDACLLEVNQPFIDLARKEWPQWSGGILPADIHPLIAQAQPYLGRHIALDITDVDGYRLIHARPIGRMDQLGQRERQVVSLYSKGKTYKEIAVQLGVSPSTVRNQLSQIYAKLNVHSRIELISYVQQLGVSPASLGSARKRPERHEGPAQAGRGARRAA